MRSKIDDKKLSEVRSLAIAQPDRNYEKAQGIYAGIADVFPLYENAPIEAEELISRDKHETLAGKVVDYVYEDLIKREHPGQFGGSQLRRINMESFRTFREIITARAKKYSIPIYNIGQDVKDLADGGHSGFHFNGQKGNNHDFLFFFDRLRSEWKYDSKGEVRAYITLKPENLADIDEIFLDLCEKLYSNQIDFTGKAQSPKGMNYRTDNIVLYIADYDQAKASELIKDFMKARKLGHGGMMLALPSPNQPGLSWARNPSEEELALYHEITGLKKASYSSYSAAMAMPEYLERIARAHEKIGNTTEAAIFRAEARRVNAVIQNYSMKPGDRRVHESTVDLSSRLEGKVGIGILSILGIMLVFFFINFRMTGNVIGENIGFINPFVIYPVSLIILFILFLYLRNKRGKFKI